MPTVFPARFSAKAAFPLAREPRPSLSLRSFIRFFDRRLASAEASVRRASSSRRATARCSSRLRW
jgi:hypothetical protein